MATRQRDSGSRDSSKQRPAAPATHAKTSPEHPLSSSSSRQAAAEPADDGAEPIPREERIALSAYLRAADRGFEPGHELEDWLAAEREIEASGSGAHGHSI